MPADYQAVVGLKGANVKSLIRKDSGGKIYNSIIDNHARPDGPERYHSAVADNFLITGAGVVFPQERTIITVKAIHITIIGTEINFAAINGRSKTNRPFGKECPAYLSFSEID
jgi:hypothetical protein